MLRAAEEHYRREQRAAALGVAAARRVWAGISFADLTGSWLALVARMVASVSAAQLLAARQADVYVSEALTEQGLDDDPDGEVAARALVGVAGDGRGLDSLLYSAVIATKEAVGGGAEQAQAMLSGRSELDMLTATAVQDAGRAAEQVAMASRRVDTYVRMVNFPACSRCIILAGSVYRTRTAFLRHPKCSCVNVPSSEDVAGDLTTNPKVAFDSLDRTEQDRIFTAAGAEAIRLGSDIGQVVNARRGMKSATAYGQKVLVTTEGTTRRGFAGRRTGPLAGGRTPRLMPETILQVADSREHVIELLRKHGYLT